MLYPLKFEPIYKERIWGGNKLRNRYNRLCPADMAVGESWEISGLSGDLSVVSNGYLAGNDIQELIEVYMGELVGDHIYNRFGEEFPLLIKLMETSADLSVQVHPDDQLAKERHNAYGKTEMWYIMEVDDDASLHLGFNRNMSSSEFAEKTAKSEVVSLMNMETPAKGDVYYIPAGTIHTAGKGLVIAEIQQTSDITYRIWDWDRTDEKGNTRELHIELAIDALDYRKEDKLKIRYETKKNKTVSLLDAEQFTANIIELDGQLERDYADLDSFVIYVCLEGDAIVECLGGAESMVDAETVLLPAEFDEVTLTGKAKLLEIYIPK